VHYTDEAIKACVTLSARYITDRCFPDKAIDVLDEAGSRVHLTNIQVPEEIEQQEARIADAQAQKNLAVKNQDYELAADYRDQEQPISVKEILYDTTPEEIKQLVDAVVDLSARWYKISPVVKPETEEKPDDEPKN
jgi:ATP-dependent Clp protease ATP-binding subunit ClpC